MENVSVLKPIFSKLLDGVPLSEEETFFIFESMIRPDASLSDAQIGAYLLATASRELAACEIVGAAKSLRKHAIAFDPNGELSELNILDTCGTGGSGLDTFNTSTAVAFVLAASGQPVAKHGNKAATSRSGSADVLTALGVNLRHTPAQSRALLKKTNFCFLFAPEYHVATRRVVGIRKELGFRTIFNFLGPLVSPASPNFQLLGVSSKSMVRVLAKALGELGVSRALVVCGEDGLDEISLSAKTNVFELLDGAVREYQISPEDVGLSTVSFEKVSGREPEASAKLMREVLGGEKSAYADLVAFNAGAALYVSQKSRTIPEGVIQAKDILKTGKALSVLEAVIQESAKNG